MTKFYVIGLDIGTTSAKAVLFQTNGKVVCESEATYPVLHPMPSWVEQNPKEIEDAAIEAIRAVLEQSNVSQKAILSVGVSSAMHSLICVDGKGNHLSNSITWADGRSVEQVERLRKQNGLDIYLQTGTPIHPMSPFAKLVWMKEQQYKPYQQAYKFVSIKEYLFFRWFGEFVVDYSVASATGLFNIHERKWEQKALTKAGIVENQLSTPVPPTYICEGLRSNIAERMGLRYDIPFAIGGSDGPLANLGIGAIAPGDVAITIGTSGAIRQMTAKPKTDEQQEIFCYSVTNDLWVMGGPTNNGAIVLQWLKDILGEHEIYRAEQTGASPYDLLTSIASTSSAGANGLLFLPFLNGERAPIWDANARGTYVGLTLSHTKADMIRASLEGVIYSIYSVGEALERLAGKPVNIFASGGFARSPLWLSILSDMFGQDVHIPESHQSSAWGAAWISLLAIGHVQSLDDIKNHIPMKESVTSNIEHHNTYKLLYRSFRDLYKDLKPHFQALATYQRQQQK
ncbi:gluconokinase [Halalkalibacterium ligniniphilum]|uniref:gluconokinase n=1 Tax=Halalkalibacterium ligniniphilum TaxID=1134413 RepID=UPI0003478130|nr:gluconokinase [Halalkalibacterium ligniniphilum]